MQTTFRLFVVALLVAMAVVQVTTALGETQTWDEGIHLAAGYSYLKTGDFRMNAEHPPLFKLLAGLPLLLLDPDPKLNHEMWEKGWQIEFGDVFMYTNRVHADKILFYGRTVTILLSALLGLAIALWTRRHFGAPAAMGALFLYALDPNFIAHGRYVTNDLMVALLSFVAVLAWAKFLVRRRKRDLAVAGVMLGLALLSKFSSLFLLPVVVLLYLVRWWQQGVEEPDAGPRLSLRHGALSLIALAVIASVVVAGVYGPVTVRSLGGPALVDQVRPDSAIHKLLYSAGYLFDLPAHPYLMGLNRIGEFDVGGHNMYLLGQRSMFGWWYYFPVVFAVKTPTAVLLLTLLSALAASALGFRWLARNERIRKLRTLPFHWIAMALPLAVFTAFVMKSHVQLGVRYLMPAYPFLFVLLAAALFHPRWARYRKAQVALIVVAGGLQLFETAHIYPDYLAFFNTPSGGPGNGPRYVVDSNIDWGQDMKKLKRYLDSRGGKDKVCITYFGHAFPYYYGIEATNLPRTKDVKERQEMDCLAVASVTQLMDVYEQPGAFRYLRELKPIAKVGYSMYVYDLRKRRNP